MIEANSSFVDGQKASYRRVFARRARTSYFKKKMFHHRLDEPANTKTYIHWLLLAASAGMINTGGFLSCGRFVSHVTGFATLAGVSVNQASLGEALGYLSIPLFFLVGVVISGLLTEKDRGNSSQTSKHGKQFGRVMGLVAGILLLVVYLGENDYFGVFGQPAKLTHDYFLLAFLCGACGLQNAAISASSGATIRTTHLTGLTTDLGLGLIRAEVHKISSEQRKQERRANWLRAFTILAFFVGSAIGAYGFLQYRYFGFLVPAALSIYFCIIELFFDSKTVKN